MLSAIALQMTPVVNVIVELEAVPCPERLKHSSPAHSGYEFFDSAWRFEEIAGFGDVLEDLEGSFLPVCDSPNVDDPAVSSIPLVTRSMGQQPK
jgi:hypothetical protein